MTELSQVLTNADCCLYEEQRLATFKEWPFVSNHKCTSNKMAEAGFLFCGSKDEPDLAQCYVCLKKLDGWEDDDDPWVEHKKHSPSCLFVKTGKRECDLTVNEVFNLSLEMTKNVMKVKHADLREKVIQQSKQVKQIIIKLRKLKK